MKNLRIKENIMSMDGKYVWVPKGSLFIFFDGKRPYYACGTYIIDVANIDHNKFDEV